MVCCDRCLADFQRSDCLCTNHLCHVNRAVHIASGKEVALKTYYRWGESAERDRGYVLNEMKMQQQCAGETVLKLVRTARDLRHISVGVSGVVSVSDMHRPVTVHSQHLPFLVRCETLMTGS